MHVFPPPFRFTYSLLLCQCGSPISMTFCSFLLPPSLSLSFFGHFSLLPKLFLFPIHCAVISKEAWLLDVHNLRIEELGGKLSWVTFSDCAKIFFYKVPFRCCLGVCCRENGLVTIKQSVFREKRKKEKRNLRVTQTLISLFLILPGGKTLNTCTPQALRYITEKTEIVIRTDTVFCLFLFSWKSSENKQVNNRARFLYLIQGQMLEFSTLEEEKKKSSQKGHLAWFSTKLFNYSHSRLLQF